jgi:hypothetical protein
MSIYHKKKCIIIYILKYVKKIIKKAIVLKLINIDLYDCKRGQHYTVFTINVAKIYYTLFQYVGGGGDV